MNIIDVASWQIPDLSPPTDNIIRATLPALQRGSVWKPHQTERLWDSLIRAFPVGAFLFAPYNEMTKDMYGGHSFRLGSQDSYTHYLLDGQQRATSIALGFYDIWKEGNFEKCKDGPVLWIDLAPSLEKDDEREFVLRLLTRSHPWGYKHKNPEQRLEVKEIRQSFEYYKSLAPTEYQSFKPSQFPLQHTWPWDAHAPIPLVFIISAVLSGKENVADEVSMQLERLPFWKSDKSDQVMVRSGKNLKDSVLLYLDGSNKARFDQIVAALRVLVAKDSRYSIPALILPDSAMSTQGAKDNDKPDAVETLFVRVNSGGTRLEGEELIYSLLKSAWKEAPQEIEKLQPAGHQLLLPTRMVTLITRMILAQQQKKDDQGNFPGLPPVPNVARFRSLIGNKEFYEKLQTFTKDTTTTKQIFVTVHDLLTLNPTKPSTDSYRLHPALAANLTQGNAGADLILLVLRWIDKMIAARHDPLKLPCPAKKKLLGFLTALSWFSLDSGRCLQRLWNSLQNCLDNQLPNFFNQKHFQSLIPLDPDKGLIILPIVPPEILEAVINDRVTNGRGSYGGFQQPDHDFWKPGTSWEHYYGRLATNEFTTLNGQLKDWLTSLPTSTDENQPNMNEVLRAAWSQFLDRIWSERRLIQYAQRNLLTEWFPDFDPTLPDQMEDINRPWDYDHIHPQNLVSGRHGIPSVVREWHVSIGNLRAWPMELNRADQDTPPRDKLIKTDPLEGHYRIDTSLKRLVASFITESEWEYWENSVAMNEDGTVVYRYLTSRDYHKYRLNLIQAITSRFCRLYREWYDMLCLKNLSDPKPQPEDDHA